MPTLELLATGLAASLALVSLGGGIYETGVVDPAWPRRVDIVQPDRGGISRRRFWIPAHVAFELSLIAALMLGWRSPEIRLWLLMALGSHAVMRLWSVFDFIPKALAAERAGPSLTEAAARRWTRRSRLRLPLDVVTCVSMLAAFAAVAKAG